ncbi:hypothetical protein [Nocardiopsis ansamitocini]|uniref:hypothetical protein n=1 Tax=Nocardiopsis ansamitocini TaxID=1670832 RepID=UPI0025568D85|nr:hypothetical protein [Nocardiopsis ansamitocini]
MHPLAQDYLAGCRALGDPTTEAIRALKRHLARRVSTLLRSAAGTDGRGALAREAPAAA